jgi:protein-tyrosine phosphatase
MMAGWIWTGEGFHNARDLGGHPTRDGRRIRAGALVRSADTRHVTPAGWAAAHAARFRTVIDLRNNDEVADATAPPALTRVRVPLDDAQDVDFWRQLDADLLSGTPLYLRRVRCIDRCSGQAGLSG